MLTSKSSIVFSVLDVFVLLLFELELDDGTLDVETGPLVGPPLPAPPLGEAVKLPNRSDVFKCTNKCL